MRILELSLAASAVFPYKSYNCSFRNRQDCMGCLLHGFYGSEDTQDKHPRCAGWCPESELCLQYIEETHRHQTYRLCPLGDEIITFMNEVPCSILSPAQCVAASIYPNNTFTYHCHGLCRAKNQTETVGKCVELLDPCPIDTHDLVSRFLTNISARFAILYSSLVAKGRGASIAYTPAFRFAIQATKKKISTNVNGTSKRKIAKIFGKTPNLTESYPTTTDVQMNLCYLVTIE